VRFSASKAMRRLDYRAPGADDQREKLDRWEMRLLIVALALLAAGIITICICFAHY